MFLRILWALYSCLISEWGQQEMPQTLSDLDGPILSSNPNRLEPTDTRRGCSSTKSPSGAPKAEQGPTTPTWGPSPRVRVGPGACQLGSRQFLPMSPCRIRVSRMALLYPACRAHCSCHRCLRCPLPFPSSSHRLWRSPQALSSGFLCFVSFIHLALS